MPPPVANDQELRRVIALREGIKGVAIRAFQVNVLGLNAILLAKQFGERARGFGVISTELRDFSKGLQSQMAGLGDNSGQLVSLATRQLKLQRQQALLQQAAQAAGHPQLQAASQQLAAEMAGLQQSIAQAHARMREWVDAAYQSCLFGTVIARSAKIEAAHAGAAGAALTGASNEFSDHVNHILPSLEQLKQALGAHA